VIRIGQRSERGKFRSEKRSKRDAGPCENDPAIKRPILISRLAQYPLDGLDVTVGQWRRRAESEARFAISV
jgi:hypothetical protein